MSSERRESPDTGIVITPDMVAIGAALIRKWEDSDEPDARVLVRELLSTILGERATFG